MNDEAALRRCLASVFLDALGSLDPAHLVERALSPRPPDRARVRIFAAGKAAPAMTRGALARWGDHVEATLVVTVDGARVALDDLPLAKAPTILRAAHPFPDERSIEAAQRALSFARGLGPDDLLLALISGGSSALLALPPPGLDLEDERRIARALLDGGAPIQDVNLVRRHLSRIKGGRLALAAAPASVRTLVLSDVVGGAIHDVGSGPTVPDPSTAEEARLALARHAPGDLASRLSPHLEDTPRPEVFPVRTTAELLAGPEDLSRAVAARLRALGLRVTELPAEAGDARDIAEQRVAQATTLAPGDALVIACEPTIVLPSRRGRGGRAGWIALSAMRRLPPDVALLCGASDGVDGSSGTAGAVVSATVAERAVPGRVDAALADFDDASAHKALGTAIETGPTGQNLTDLHVIARLPRAERISSGG